LIRSYSRDERAASAVEFALVAPVLFTLVFAIIGASVLYFAQSAMHWAAEAGARHWALNTGLVADAAWKTNGLASSTSPGSWAFKAYHGPRITGLKFQGVKGSCGASGAAGWIINAQASYTLNAVLVKPTATLSSGACYPVIQ
jgi:hypothetical protein